MYFRMSKFQKSFSSFLPRVRPYMAVLIGKSTRTAKITSTENRAKTDAPKAVSSLDRQTRPIESEYHKNIIRLTDVQLLCLLILGPFKRLTAYTR